MNPAQLASLQAMLSQAQQHQAKPILEQKAGVLTLQNKTLAADPRRGKIQLIHEDGILRFQWILRPSGTIEENLLLFPGSATFTHLPECKDGQVYLLKFKDSSKRLFFWLQEVETKERKEKKEEEEFVKKMQEYLLNPPQPNGGGGGMDLSSLGLGGLGGFGGVN